MTQPRYPRKFVPKPGTVTTIHYWMQYVPDGQLTVHFRDGLSGESGNTIDTLLADGNVEVFDHLPAEDGSKKPLIYEAMTYAPPAEEVSYGAEEIDGTRTVIVQDAGQGDDWQPSKTPPACAACNVPWSDHLGVQGTCAKLLELQEHERQTHERLGAILGTDDSLEECAKRLKAEVERLKESFDAVWSVCVECGMKEEKMSAEDAAESGCDEGDVYACQYGFIRNLHRRAEAAEAELNRLRNQLRIEYSRNEALARIRDAVGRIAQVFGDDVHVMPIDSEIGCVQMVLNRYKELETRAVSRLKGE